MKRKGEQSMSLKHKIKRVDENGTETTYRDLREAASSINSKLEPWKVQLFIAYALNTRTRAFKSKWMPIK
jgi:hypothetical protein